MQNNKNKKSNNTKYNTKIKKYLKSHKNLFSSSISFFTLTSLIFGISSCAPNTSQSIHQASVNMTQALGCQDLKSLVFDSFYGLIESEHQVPTAQSLKLGLQQQLSELKQSKQLNADEAQTLDQIHKQLDDVIEIMLEQTQSDAQLQFSSDATKSSVNSGVDDDQQDTEQAEALASAWKAQIQKIIKYEMQSETDPSLIPRHQKIHQALNKVNRLSAELPVSCQVGYKATAAASALPSAVSLQRGMNRMIATAYQSCQSLDLPPVDSSTPNVIGITRLAQKHPDGIGAKRVVSDLKSVQNTHYYLRNSQLQDASCFNTHNNPLIYDYGGEPAISANTINLFKNAGTGTAVLGIDCSALVSSAIALAGLRYQPGLPNKTVYIRQSSGEFIDAAASKFTCFDNITVTPTQSIKAGDVLGVKGHVVSIDRVGADPFGLAAIKTVSGCSQLNYKNFDIDVAQSSPSKNGIGINKYKVKDYLDETVKMKTAFVSLGQQACLAKFQNKNIKPKNSEWGFIRHKGTPECLDKRVSVVGESCVQKCF